MNAKPPPSNSPVLKPKGPRLSSAAAQARLADALRENLRRRKAQVRARETGDGNESTTAKDRDKT